MNWKSTFLEVIKITQFSDDLMDLLVEDGYTHCFFLAGGNIMHLLNSAHKKLTCIPVVHEVAAGIAVEYFNISQNSAKAFALVTAGPGLTNIITSLAGAWHEGRELLVIGGQVKSSDLSHNGPRQRGIQEIDGTALVSSITNKSIRLESPISKAQLHDLISIPKSTRPGPVFIEVCLDAQAAPAVLSSTGPEYLQTEEFDVSEDLIEQIISDLKRANRPILLIGGGMDFNVCRKLSNQLQKHHIPVMTTFNGADRFNDDYMFYAGRPNTWGQRYSNILLQQSDLVIALGTRLGLQQTGFNWQNFSPLARLVQVDIDESELSKGHPHVDLPICADANYFLEKLLLLLDEKLDIEEWLNFISYVKAEVPVLEDNQCGDSFISPYVFWNSICKYLPDDAVVIPSSSGGTFTTSYQSIALRGSQRIFSNKSLASMGYGLSGAIGASIANPDLCVLLGEGDGGFAQNLQELGTISSQNLNVKMFVFDNDGYASIRMTQKNYFDGKWIGCDSKTGVGLPDWELIAQAYGITFMKVESQDLFSPKFLDLLNSQQPVFFQLICDPNQTYFPKISSELGQSGQMTSNPLHLMTPPLSEKVSHNVLKFLT